MATWTSFYIKTPEIKIVVEKIKPLAKITATAQGNFPEDFSDSFLLNEALPNYLLIAKTQPDWITINYNSSNKLTEWCIALSKELNTEIIVILAQSVSDYYYFAYYDKGKKLREIECCYSEDIDEVDYGNKFPFENEKPGKKTGYNGRAGYLFVFDSIEKYCNYFGLTIQTEYSKVMWTSLKGAAKGQTIKDFMKAYKKPWWKFW